MIGGTPWQPALCIFAGLGDLPDAADVRVDIPMCTLPIAIRAGSPRPLEPEPLADLRESKLLREPFSPLLRPPPQSLDSTRSLTERFARSGQVKRKAEPDIQATRAFHAIDMVEDDRSNLGALVKGIATDLDQLALDDAESVGRNLTRKLGGVHLPAADRDIVLAQVMAAALSQPQSTDVLAALLRGMGRAMTASPNQLHPLQVDAAFEQAAQRSIDPVMSATPRPVGASAFRPCHGPLRVLAGMLLRSAHPDTNIHWLTRQLMKRVAADPDSAITGDDLTRGAFALQALRFALGDSLGVPAVRDAIVTAVARHASRSRYRPDVMGRALSILLETAGQLGLEALQVGKMARLGFLSDRQLGFLIWGFLGASLPQAGAVQSPPITAADAKAAQGNAGGGKTPAGGLAPSGGSLAFQRLASQGTLLAPWVLGRATYALALSTGDTRHWGPHCQGRAADLIGIVLMAGITLDDARRIALVAGLQQAIARLAQASPTFAWHAESLRERALGLRATFARDKAAMRHGLALAGDPQVAIHHPGLSPADRSELLDLAQYFGAAPADVLEARRQLIKLQGGMPGAARKGAVSLDAKAGDA